MSATRKYTEEEAYNAFAKCVNFVRDKEQEAERERKALIATFQTWKPMRKRTISQIASLAAEVKKLVSDISGAQVVCKGASVAGKVALFGGPIAIFGALLSLGSDVVYGLLSFAESHDMEVLYKKFKRTLEMDAENSRQMYDIVRKMDLISEAVQKCTKTLHSATVRGAFDDVPHFRGFAARARNINMNDLGGIKKFLNLVWDTAQSLAQGQNPFCRSVPNWRSYNPDKMVCGLTVGRIVLDCASLCSVIGGAQTGAAVKPIGRFLKPLNIMAITADVVDIFGKLSTAGEYPELSKKMLELEREMVRDFDAIAEAVGKQ